MEVISKVSTKLLHVPEKGHVAEPVKLKGIDGEMHKHITDWSRIGFKDKKGKALPAEVALCLGAVKYYRGQMLPVKSLILCARLFDKVVDWCRFQMLDSKAEMDFLNITLDGVFIRKASIVSIKEFDVEFYTSAKTPQA